MVHTFSCTSVAFAPSPAGLEAATALPPVCWPVFTLMASSVTEGVSPPPLSPVLSERHTSRSGENFLASPRTEKREGQPFSSRPSPCHASSSSYLPSADSRSSEADSPSKRRAVCPVFVPSLRLSEANLSPAQPGRGSLAAGGSGLLSASFQSRGSSSPQRTSSSGSGVSACFNSPARGYPPSSMEESREAQCFSRDGSPRPMNVSSSGVCTPGLTSDESGSSTEFPSQLLWVAIPLTHASSPSSSLRNEHLNLLGSSASSLNENPLSTASARPHRAEVKSEFTYTPTSELAKFHPESDVVTTPHVSREAIARTLDRVLRKAPTSSVRSALESGMKASLICRIDPLVDMSCGGGEPGAVDDDSPSSSLRSLVQKQRVVVLGSCIPSPRARSADACALSSSSPVSLESLLREIKVSEDERSSVDVLREQNRKLEEILGKTTSQGELKRDLWRLQLLQIQQQSQLRKQTAKMIEALDTCRSLLSITGSAGAGMPLSSVASLERIDGREVIDHDDASNTKDSQSQSTGGSTSTKGRDRRSIASAKLSELLALIQDAISLGGGVTTGGGDTSSSNTCAGVSSSSQGPGLCAGRGGGESCLVHPSLSSSSADHFNPPGVSSSLGSPLRDGKSAEGGSRGGPQREGIDEDTLGSGSAQRTTPTRQSHHHHHFMARETDQRQSTPSSMSQYSSTPQGGGGHGCAADSSSAFHKGMTGITGRGGGVPPLAMGFLTNQQSHRSGHMEGREGAFSPALSRDYSRRFSSRASFSSSSVSLTNNSCSSLCTSRSDLSTYRGNNNLSGDEAGGGGGGGEGGVLRRREQHSSRMTPPAHRERNKPATTFVSKWKGRPVFVPRLNLTGEDDEEEEDQGTGGDAGEENSIMSLFVKEGEGTGLVTSSRGGGCTGPRVEEDRRGGEEEGGQAHSPKRGEREGTSARRDNPQNASRSDQRSREMHLKESESMCTPRGRDQQVVGGPGGGSAKIEATWRLQQHLLQQRHGAQHGSPGRGSESIVNSSYVADQFQSSPRPGRQKLSPEDSRLDTAPLALSSSFSREERQRCPSRIEEGEGGPSPRGGGARTRRRERA